MGRQALMQPLTGLERLHRALSFQPADRGFSHESPCASSLCYPEIRRTLLGL